MWVHAGPYGPHLGAFLGHLPFHEGLKNSVSFKFNPVSPKMYRCSHRATYQLQNSRFRSKKTITEIVFMPKMHGFQNRVIGQLYIASKLRLVYAYAYDMLLGISCSMFCLHTSPSKQNLEVFWLIGFGLIVFWLTLYTFLN